MIQELISTSVPRNLSGNPGFGIVAQTRGMPPNVGLAVDPLSGYTHIAAAGSGKNPVAYLHAIRRIGGTSLHIVSRVADCGNDYSGRTNRIAHHWIIEEGYVRNLLGGPADLAAQNIFCVNWNDKPTELPPKNLRFPDVAPEKCIHWERMTGDAGWGGIVAEHAEKGAPISIIFTPEQHSGDTLRSLIGEVLALLPALARWRVTFSTYYMRSQETSSDRIQIKCFLASSVETQFAQQLPNTLLIDLRQRLTPPPAGKYVELARGAVKQPTPPKEQPKVQVPGATTAPPLAEQPYGLQPQTTISVPGVGVPLPGGVVPKKRRLLNYVTGGGEDSSGNKNDYTTALLCGIALLILALLVIIATVIVPLFKANESGRTVEPMLSQIIETLQELGQRLEDIDRPKIHDADELAKVVLQRINKILITENETLKKWKEIRQQLDALPSIWKGLALPLEDRGMILAETKFLNEYLKDLKIDYVRFVNLSSPLSDSLKITVEEPASNRWIFKHHESEEKFAEIYLSEDGLHFRWNFDYITRWGNSMEHAATYNRILLSKLRITIGDHSRDIVLWEPRASPHNLFNLLDLDGSDTLSIRYAIDLSQLENLPAHPNADINNKLQAIYLSHPEAEDKLLLMETE